MSVLYRLIGKGVDLEPTLARSFGSTTKKNIRYNNFII
jgi:hypothetical protein